MMKTHLLVVICLAWLLAGCSTIVTSHVQKAPLMQKYLQGDTAGALAVASQKLVSTQGTGDELVWLLEAANLNFTLGNYDECLEQFKRCEAVIEDFDDRALVSLRDVGSESLAMLTNLNALPYRGWCRDRVALGFYKSLAYLGSGREDAFRAQVKRLREEHQRIEQAYRKIFEAEEEQVAKARAQEGKLDVAERNKAILADARNAQYLSGMKTTLDVAHRGYGGFLNPATLFLAGLSAARDGNWDSARIEFQRLFEAMPANPQARQYYVTALARCGQPIPAGLADTEPFAFPLERNCVYVVFAHGSSASLRQISLYFPVMVSWPLCEFHPSMFSCLQVEADGGVYVTQPLADMDGIVAQEYSERQAAMLTRTVLNTLIKEAAYHATMESIRRSNMKPADKSMAMGGAALGWVTYRILTNTADTRGWETLPKEYQLTQLPMPAGRALTLTVPGTAMAAQVAIPEGCGSAIVFVNAPTPQNFSYRVFPLK